MRLRLLLHHLELRHFLVASVVLVPAAAAAAAADLVAVAVAVVVPVVALLLGMVPK